MPVISNRLTYALLLVAVVIAGLLSRSRFAAFLPSFIAEYAGDTLWALAVFLTFRFLFPKMRPGIAALIALGISFSVEISQLYQAEWINAIRRNRLAALFLGVGFKWSDLPCYTVGCLIGFAGEVLFSVAHKTSNADETMSETQ